MTGKYVYLGARVLAAIILLQTLFFKFTASHESVFIFTKIGAEPWGRIGIGVMELLASVLMLVPFTAWLGSLMGIGLMSGAVFFHLTVLGISVLGDGGYLFFLCLATLICCLYILWASLPSLPDFVKRLLPKFIRAYIDRKEDRREG